MRALRLLFTATVLAASPFVAHERRGSLDVSSGTKRVELDPSTVLPVRIAIKERNTEYGLKHLLDVSSPSSQNYGKFWTSSQVAEEFGASNESIEVITTWLNGAGILHPRLVNNRGWLAFDAAVSTLDGLLDTHYYAVRASQNGQLRVGCDRYSLPASVRSHVDMITPGVTFSGPLQKSRRGDSTLIKKRDEAAAARVRKTLTLRGTDLDSCGFNITPACVQALYDLPDPGSTTIASDALGIYEEFDLYNQTDLDSFFASYAPYIPQGTHPKLVTINPTNSSTNVGESDLDFDMVYGLLGNVPVTQYQTYQPAPYNASFNIFDWFLNAVDDTYCTSADRQAGFQCGGENLTDVVSFSYGFPEFAIVTAASQIRTCNEFMKYGLQGHTFVVSTGDYGVASNPRSAPTEFLCANNGCYPQNLDNTGQNIFNGTIFSPQYPANCPYVLAVGATELLGGQTPDDAESVLHQGAVCVPPGVTFSSGGGFSNYFERPSYQNSTVESYFASHDPGYQYYTSNGIDITENSTNIGKNGGIYNRAGRAFPDVAAIGANFTIFQTGVITQQAGTSVAAPVWASIITLINAKRKEAGKGPVGFVNPTLYQNPQAFHDLTIGSNPGCGTNGFPAVTGWDPSTGLGTPDYPQLLDIFLNLPMHGASQHPS